MTQTPMTRVPRTRDEARSTYDRLSRYYDTLASSEKAYIDAGLARLDIHPGETVLEIGFGTGRALLDLARQVDQEGRVVGIDLSEGMCAVAREKIDEAGLQGRVALAVGDARDLPYGSGEVDAVFMSFTLELFDTPDIPTVLAGCRRVLRQGGRLGVVSLSRDRELGLAGRLYEWLHTRFPRYLDCRPIPVRDLLEGAGFRIVDMEQQSMWGLPVAIALAQPREGREL